MKEIVIWSKKDYINDVMIPLALKIEAKRIAEFNKKHPNSVMPGYESKIYQAAIDWKTTPSKRAGIKKSLLKIIQAGLTTLESTGQF